MNPLIGAALISGASSLLGGLFGGMAKKQEQKQAQELWSQRLAQYQQAMKPTRPYYQSPYYPGIDRVLALAVLGNLGQRLGEKTTRWGIDLDEMRRIMGLSTPFGQTQIARQFYPQIRPQSQYGRQYPGAEPLPFVGADYLSRRYNLMR